MVTVIDDGTHEEIDTETATMTPTRAKLVRRILSQVPFQLEENAPHRTAMLVKTTPSYRNVF